MRRAASLIFFFAFLFLPLTAQEAQPEITADTPPAEPNQVVVIRITVRNPSTAEMLWDNVLRIEDTHPFLVPVKAECALSDKIKPGEVGVGELTIQVIREADAGIFPVVITLSGGVGACQEGCIPYLVEKEVSVKVVREEPELKVVHTVQGTSIEVVITNEGTSRVQNITCEGESVGMLSPGATSKITLQKKSSFTITYQDKYGKEFSESYRVNETVDTSEKDSSIQSVLVGVGIIMGYIFKRSKN